jgi:hypothetical protein
MSSEQDRDEEDKREEEDKQDTTDQEDSCMTETGQKFRSGALPIDLLAAHDVGTLMEGWCTDCGSEEELLGLMAEVQNCCQITFLQEMVENWPEEDQFSLVYHMVARLRNPRRKRRDLGLEDEEDEEEEDA